MWNNTLTHETPDDDEFYIGESRATIDRRASRNDTYRYGVAYRRSDERVGDEWNTFSLIDPHLRRSKVGSFTLYLSTPPSRFSMLLPFPSQK